MTAFKQLMIAPILRQNEVSLGHWSSRPPYPGRSLRPSALGITVPACISLGICLASSVLSLGPFVSARGVPGILLTLAGPLVLGPISISCVFRPKTCNAARKALVLR